MEYENQQQFTTSDFYTATYCLAKGLKLLTINWVNPRRATFVFQDTESRQRLVEDFLYGRSLVEPQSFIAANKQLKELLHRND